MGIGKLRIELIRQAIALSDYLYQFFMKMHQSILETNCLSFGTLRERAPSRREVASRRVGHKERKFGAAS
ncbi:MAG: hypothetical protein V7L21_29860 [Nostoc sp.]|uniref:hypothetical protein n=1 Tax=Nostoc sp. TaxID=1180 RepID=UPI002FF4EB4B